MELRCKTKRAVAGLVGAVAMLLAGAAQAALQDRDLDGDTVVDAFYDTDLDITWLRDANVNGAMDWDSATSWANGLVAGTASDWRLPTGDLSCATFDCLGSEMGHLYYVELGNSAGALTNTGTFQNVQPNYYWTSTDFALEPNSVLVFGMFNGGRYYSHKDEAL